MFVVAHYYTKIASLRERNAPLTRRAESRRVCPPESAANPHVLKTTFVAWTSTSPGAAAFMPASKLPHVAARFVQEVAVERAAAAYVIPAVVRRLRDEARPRHAVRAIRDRVNDAAIPALIAPRKSNPPPLQGT